METPEEMHDRLKLMVKGELGDLSPKDTAALEWALSQVEARFTCHCGGVILADTEDWNQPLCPTHYDMVLEDGHKLAKYWRTLAERYEVALHEIADPDVGGPWRQDRALLALKK